jgi:TRAP-type uncharacterized transport system substrate-binding protein
MSRMTVLVLVVLAAVWWVVGHLDRALPPTLVVIQAGPPGGSFDAHARRYAEVLAKQGLQVEVRNMDDSLRIIDQLDQGASGAQIGFTAQRVDAARHPKVASAGVVELQPLFLFVRSSLAATPTLAGLAGHKLVMPPAGSITARAAQDVLERYGVNTTNAAFTFTPLGEAATALQRGAHDAGFFVLAPDNALMRQLASDPGLTMYSINDSAGIARNIDYLKPATLVRGAFDLKAPLPPQDVALVGATVNVVVREDIHPAVLYALLQAMSEVHKGQTLVSDAGEYPRQAGAALAVHPHAREWAKTGTPWLYAQLPPALAGVVDAYWAPALALLALASAFGSLQSVNGLIDNAVLAASWHWLGWLQRWVEHGGQPGWASRKLFKMVEPVVVQQGGQEQRTRERLERLRPHM